MKESKIKKYVGEGWVHAKMIFEIAGKPESHVNKTMKETVHKFGEEKIKLIKAVKHPAKNIGEGVFSTFSEVEFLTSRISYLFEFVYDYMPSSLEIMGPDSMTETASNIADILNDVMAKLHQYDNAFKNLYVRNINLQNELANSGQTKKKKK